MSADLAFPARLPGRPRLRVFVTVGMGQWPFDRLVAALPALCDSYDVVAQTGTSRLRPPCPHEPFVSLPVFDRLLDEADVVVTHAGNTVRVAQRKGHVPVAVARRRDLGEMANDHQVEFLADEQDRGPVIAVWDTAELRSVLDDYGERRRAVASRPLPGALPPEAVLAAMEEVEEDVTSDPFAHEPMRRYSYAWRAVHRVEGPHLDVGCARGDFPRALAASSGRPVVGVDVNESYLADVRRTAPCVGVARVGVRGCLPFQDETFTSATLLDVLEHCADETELLTEIHRVLRPGSVLVVTVPARGRLDLLDPDDVKYRLPTLHRLVYSARFGGDVYRERFGAAGRAMFGDSAATRGRHDHYDEREVEALLGKAGFDVVSSVRSGLLCNQLDVVGKLLGRRARAAIGALTALDADVFATANLFMTARRPA